ncbi:hypothetical protein B0A55_08692 [Friedmanniomyces simplex]|uniref:EGF-like domain-containing protein n=1 Tax=Friedmanniomyces simplex TaxID=329884 RepID=A0A4U0WX88_9PEZI|nr:hypothetical protein B0A55_08692 [Friedmanniomyces simplex]
MSYQYHDQGGQYGIPHYPSEPPRSRQMLPSQGRRPPPQQMGQGSSAHRGPPPVRPMRPGQQQYAAPMSHPPPPPPRPEESTENLYDGSAYGEPEFVEQNESWPLPAAPSRPYVEQGRSNSPQNRSPSGQRRPPQRPQRPDFDEPVLEPPRQARVAPANQQYRQPPPPPPPPPSHHGPGQWNGESYSSPSSAYPPQLQQAVYQQGSYGQANRRPPLGPPPSSRRGPASYYPQIAPVHPIAEETDSVRGSIRQGSSIYPGHDSVKSYASSNAIPIGIPDYYLEQRDSMPGAERPLSEDDDYGMDESPVDRHPNNPLDEREEGYSSREEASPEPAALIRQASFGRKSKPTLTTVKSGERMRKASGNEGVASLPSQQRAAPNVPAAMHKEAGFAKETGGSVESGSEKESYEEPRDARHFGNGDKGLEAGGAATVAAVAVAAPLYAVTNKSKENLSQRTRSSDVLSSGTGLLDPSSSSESENSPRNVQPKSSKELLGVRPKPQNPTSRERSPLAQEVDPRLSQILAGLHKGGALTSPSESEKLKLPRAGLSEERAGRRRPPRLDVDAVRDAEARGSLTSLPDLIVRATRLASNLDRGKTASRLGMHWTDGADADGKEKKRRSGHSGANGEKRRSGSISDMLASFPPPGLATPPGSRGGLAAGENNGGGGGGRSLTNWSSNLRHSHLPSDSDADELSRRQGRRGRRMGRGGGSSSRCCGMPLWVFLLLLVLLILLVAAAIIVPVVLVVVPRQLLHNGGGGSGQSSSAGACASNSSCLNGGASVLSPADNSCHCVCVNGFTGATCAVVSGAGCATLGAGAGAATGNATVGDALPRLLDGAEGNFSVPLDGPRLVALFSGAGLSCQAENALVTFGGSAGLRRWVGGGEEGGEEDDYAVVERVEEDVVVVEQGEEEEVLELEPKPTPTVRKRQTAATGSDGAATSDGIVYATGTPTPAATTATPTPAASASSSSSSSSPSSSSSSSSSSPSSSNSTTTTTSTQQDFARIAVLYVLQTSAQLSAAVTAQESLQAFFTSGRTATTGQAVQAGDVGLGGGVSVDLVGGTIRLGNGTVVGGG